ncbi:MAG: hypothetical protein M1324_04720 [Patescibacteria group bacterium]|nr:hypothetical protein [Patescibacteria group bacterium]
MNFFSVPVPPVVAPALFVLTTAVKLDSVCLTTSMESAVMATNTPVEEKVDPARLRKEPPQNLEAMELFQKLYNKINLCGRRNENGATSLLVERRELDIIVSSLKSRSSLAEDVNSYGRKSEKMGLVWVTSRKVSMWIHLLRSGGTPRVFEHRPSVRNKKRVDRHGIPVHGNSRNHFRPGATRSAR